MIKAEGFVGTTIVQLFSFIRINVIHHQADIILCKIVKAFSFGMDSQHHNKILWSLSRRNGLAHTQLLSDLRIHFHCQSELLETAF